MYEMQDLSQQAKTKQTGSDSQHDTGEKLAKEVSNASDVAVWAMSSASILFLSAVFLFASPRLLLFLSSSSSAEHRDALTPLESFLSIQLGLLLLAVSVCLIIAIPSGEPISRVQEGRGHPLLYPLTASCGISAIVSYNADSSKTGGLGVVVFLISSVIALWGFWVVLFEGSSLVSKKTGADKRTSAFLFWNKNAASLQKKELKRRQGQ
ncbi:hypothetical protein SISSUDRAFT_141923 [Sistotremastrum suecicum HHB10207 ss-3]|uniref:Uncharacterized protein n=1 Tax=Sistotremastrum suecicum HHB10207 ss-3 TaxID=1314776 RepID=A0A166GUJ0_9AGAM|nr:hypothetical protein SISSUDRAFT_141923 [Sistotremastrum suecicum HHB10207 ss-3]